MYVIHKQVKEIPSDKTDGQTIHILKGIKGNAIRKHNRELSNKAYPEKQNFGGEARKHSAERGFQFLTSMHSHVVSLDHIFSLSIACCN